MIIPYPLEQITLKRLPILTSVKDVKQLKFSSTASRCKIVQLIWKCKKFLIKLLFNFTYHWNISLSGDYLSEIKIYIHKKTPKYSITIQNTWKVDINPDANDNIFIQWKTTQQCKRTSNCFFQTTCLNLKSILLKSWTQKFILYGSIYIKS